MIWWRHKENNGRWSRQWYNYRWTIRELRRARAAVGIALDEYPDADKVRDQCALGFTPRTFVTSVAAKAGIELPTGFDGIILSNAMYHRIQVWQGDEPPYSGDRVWLLPNVLLENQKPRLVRLK